MEIKEKIKKIIDDNEVCLFMKGTPDSPQDKELKILVIGQLYLNFI